MKSRVSINVTVVLIASLFLPVTVNADKKKNIDRDQRVEKSISVAETVVVSLCVTSGDLTVHGWERKEVRARARNASQVELRRDGTEGPGPATHITVLLSGSGTGYRAGGVDCQVFGDVELDVPRGATVRLRSGDGNVRVTGVAGALVETQSGDIEITEVAQAIEAGTLNGAVKATNCTGSARFHSVGGNIQATNMRGAGDDDFSATTVSGDISLDRIGHQQVTAKTATGSVGLIGPLVKGGRYSFGTISGNVTLRLPPDSSFQLSAKVSPQGEIVSDFPLSPSNAPAPPVTAETAPKKPTARIRVADPSTRKMNGAYGGGDATISLASFSGLLVLRRE